MVKEWAPRDLQNLVFRPGRAAHEVSRELDRCRESAKVRERNSAANERNMTRRAASGARGKTFGLRAPVGCGCLIGVWMPMWELGDASGNAVIGMASHFRTGPKQLHGEACPGFAGALSGLEAARRLASRDGER